MSQVYYEDIEPGLALPQLVKHPTTKQLVQWAGASGDFYQIHYDKDYAIANELPGVIVHGWLTASFLGQMVTDWMGAEGNIAKLECGYRGMFLPNEDLTCKGTVTRKYVKDGKGCVDCSIWAENPKGEKNANGSATVILPSKGSLS